MPTHPRHSHRVRILAALTVAGPRGLTWEEAGNDAHVEEAWKRISDLKNMGLVTVAHDDRGQTVTRRLSSGRLGQVWRVADAPDVAVGPPRLFET